MAEIISNADLTASTGGAVINNQDITATANGTYTAESGYTGLGTVTVNVAGASPVVKDSVIRVYTDEVTYEQYSS